MPRWPLSRTARKRLILSSHLYNTLHGLADDAVDITFSQMVLLQKLTTLAWNVHDGRRKREVCVIHVASGG